MSKFCTMTTQYLTGYRTRSNYNLNQMVRHANGFLPTQTRPCNDILTCLFGGQGERIQIDSPCCFGCFQRSSFPCPFLPMCCPTTLFPCILRHEIYVSDAEQGTFQIKLAREAAFADPLYLEDKVAINIKSGHLNSSTSS